MASNKQVNAPMRNVNHILWCCHQKTSYLQALALLWLLALPISLLLPSLALLHWLENMHQIFLYFYNSSRKFINYNKNNNISHTEISPSTTYMLNLPNTQAESKHSRRGRLSVRWLQPGVQLTGVVCPAPRLDNQAPGFRCPRRHASSLVHGTCCLRPHIYPHQILQFTVKAFIVYSICTIVSKSIIYNEFIYSI